MKGNVNGITLLRKNPGGGGPLKYRFNFGAYASRIRRSGPGFDAPLAEITAAGPQAEDESALCPHIDAQGRRCRMLVMSIEADLCAYHAQHLGQTQGVSEAAQELLACGTDFGDAPAVNRFLGTLVRQVTLKRIPRRDAVTLAYLCQLLLNSLSAIDREQALRLEESRIAALNRSKLPPRIIWDIPGPPYEPVDPEVKPKNWPPNESGGR